MNCFYEKRDYWFKKPITRCPNCNRSLKQNTQKKKWKEKNKILSSKSRQKYLKQLRVKRWKSKNKDKLKAYNKTYWQENFLKMKNNRIKDGRYAETLAKNRQYQKTHLKEILNKRRDKRNAIRLEQKIMIGISVLTR